jgi:hypothetical protein
LPAEPAGLLGRVRSLSQSYQAGGPQALRSFEELASLLLQLTVMKPSGQVRLARGPDRQRAALGGVGGAGDALPLNDGRFLRLDVGLHLARQTPRARRELLKVEKASYQYQREQGGRDGGGWIFRYDYLRQPGPDAHPGSHLQIEAQLAHPEVLAEGVPLRRIHFPVGRIGLEAVIRLLADEFQVPTNEDPQMWRAALAESERLFLEIAHQPLSGLGV